MADKAPWGGLARRRAPAQRTKSGGPCLGSPASPAAVAGLERACVTTLPHNSSTLEGFVKVKVDETSMPLFPAGNDVPTSSSSAGSDQDSTGQHKTLSMSRRARHSGIETAWILSAPTPGRTEHLEARLRERFGIGHFSVAIDTFGLPCNLGG